MASLVCPPDAVNVLTDEPISEITDKTRIVKLKPRDTVECYDFVPIYTLQRAALASDRAFISPLTRTPYNENDRQAIETARLLYISRHPEEAKDYPTLLNPVEGESSLADAFGAIMGIATGVAEARPRLERILARGIVTPHTRDNDGRTLLYAAIDRGVVDLIPRFKTPEGFKLDSNGYTPFLMACSSGNLAIIEAVAPEPSDADAVNAVDSDGNNALLLVAGVWNRRAREQSGVTLTYLMDRYGYDPNQRNSDGVTPLLAALANNNTSGATVLINRNADVNALDKSKNSPLLYAASNGDPQVVRLLLEQGARMFRNLKHETAFDIAKTEAATSRQNPLSKNRPARDAIVELLRTVPLSEHANAVVQPPDLVQRSSPNMAVTRRKVRIAQLLRERVDRKNAEAYANAVNAAVAAGRDPTTIPIPQYIKPPSLSEAAKERQRIQELKWLAQHGRATARGGRRRRRSTRKNRHRR